MHDERDVAQNRGKPGDSREASRSPVIEEPACVQLGDEDAPWQLERGGLGPWYSYLELTGLLLTVIVSVRAHVQLGRPAARPFVSEHWRYGQLYKNADDPALFVPTRNGARWTLNFGRPVAAALMALILTVGIVGPAIILGLLLR